MAKKSRKRPGRQDQSGCMWSLINIFDFRQARSSQKLLLDKKRGSRRIDGAAYANIKLESLNDACQIYIENNDLVQSEASTIDNWKMSVKELMEEEMCGEKKDASIPSGDVNVKQSGVDNGAPVKKSRRWTRRKMSIDLGAEGVVVPEQLVGERPNHRKHKSCSSLDLNEMVEELCSGINQKDTSDLKHHEDGEPGMKPIGDPSIIEKQLAEATKVLVKYFTDGKCGTKDRKAQPSKELTDALRILNSSKELFLKLLQDPNSQLVKNIQSLQDIEVEEGKFKVLTGSDMLEQDTGNAKPPSFFWSRFKGQDQNSLKRSESSEDLNRIVLLKPGPPSSRNSDMASSCSSLTESPQTTGDKGQFEKALFPFSFSEFKRKLKQAMRKEQHELSRQSSEEQPNISSRNKKVGVDSIPMASPSRDHFFIERIPKSSVGVKKVDKSGKLKDGKIHLEYDSALTAEQKVSNIYTEAKKHLAEIVGSNYVGEDTQDRRVPKSLGRIISYSGYSSPTIGSPRKGDISLCPNTECQSDDKRTSKDLQEVDVSLSDQVRQDSESIPFIPSDKTIHNDEFSAIEPHISDGNSRRSDVDEPILGPEVPSSEAIMKSADAESEKEDNLETSAEPCSPNITKTEKADSSVCFEENQQSTSLGQTTSEENDHSSRPDLSLNYSVIEKNEDLDAMSDATSRPSPISVLEPIFKEDVISPPAVKYFSAGEPIRPRQIKFEEEISAPIGRIPSNRTSVDDDKYTIDFVKAVVEMSGLTWDELLRRSLFSDDVIDPSLIDEVDFLPDLLSCDFILLFDLINEVVIEICWLNFGCMLSLATPFVQPHLKRKDIFTEIWKVVNWYLKMEGLPPTLDQIVAKDFAKPGKWPDVHFDRENIGIQLQEVIFDELVEDAILSCINDECKSDPPIS